MTNDERRHEAEVRAREGDWRAAAALYEQAGLPLEAAQAYRSAGDLPAALAGAGRISSDDPSYREACVLAVTLADELDRLSLALDNFLARFLRAAPQNGAELEALERLARLYERHGFVENAIEVYRKLSGVRPEYGEAAARLVAPGAAAVPDLPDLPDLPPVPPPAAPDAAAAHAAATAEPKEEERPVFRPGVVIAGRYKLEERVGAGGMSVVFRATDFDLGDEIALKVLTHAVFDPETDARLRRELMLSRQLLHPNVVRVFEMGLAQGFRYLTMELLVGHKLADRLHSGPIGLDEGLGYLAQACAGLQAAHDLGIVHRDVKPNNFFITEGHVLKVMDFGLAKVRGAQGLTASGVIGGTPAYMAPEQASDFRAVTPASDIYALGVVAYEMFTGALPFSHENPLSILIMHRETPPPPPRSRNPSLPDELESIILDCLQKDPARRITSCREMGRRVRALRAR